MGVCVYACVRASVSARARVCVCFITTTDIYLRDYRGEHFDNRETYTATQVANHMDIFQILSTYSIICLSAVFDTSIICFRTHHP